MPGSSPFGCEDGRMTGTVYACSGRGLDGPAVFAEGLCGSAQTSLCFACESVN